MNPSLNKPHFSFLNQKKQFQIMKNITDQNLQEKPKTENITRQHQILFDNTIEKFINSIQQMISTQKFVSSPITSSLKILNFQI
ncbi:hypothetical protein M0811_14088 [Anaeramoeba ignava]|uniref:Uncharacterized protein n=1 Tax=Anaeramoeba ignava TaxID=1746090 RepID=A0A9Q0RHT4_ANAIG|nr:hypothetical protein M0811_14088 [Anaeramoeba ignava]